MVQWRVDNIIPCLSWRLSYFSLADLISSMFEYILRIDGHSVENTFRIERFKPIRETIEEERSERKRSRTRRARRPAGAAPWLGQGRARARPRPRPGSARAEPGVGPPGRGAAARLLAPLRSIVWKP